MRRKALGTTRVHERIEYNGTDYIKLLERDTLKRLDVTWCQTKSDLQALSRLYRELMSAAQRWWWVDTGVQLMLVPTEYGFIWLVPDEAENSRRIKWLMSRADRFEQKIVKRINDHASVLSEDSSKVEEIINGPGEGEYYTDSPGEISGDQQ